MQTTKKTLEQIAKFEGERLTAYRARPKEKYLTIGIGHYGPDVTPGKKITHEQALELFAQDIRVFENHVTVTGLEMNQEIFDSLVSFTYNCGVGNLQKLIKGRTLQQIADTIPLYNKSCGEVLSGLVKRRKWEQELFLSGLAKMQKKEALKAEAPKPEAKKANPYPAPDKNLKRGSKGVTVRWLQRELIERGYGILCDGDYGPKTEACVRDYQNQRDLTADGIVGPLTRAALESGK